MKKVIIFSLIGIALVAILIWFGKKNNAPTKMYDTDKPFKTTIVNKTIATGKVIPLDQVVIKPQISGIIDKVLVEEGKIIKKGELIATVKVVPNIQSLNSANGELNNAKITYENAKVQYERSQTLLEKGVISRREYENTQLSFNNAKQRLSNARSNINIIKRGTTPGLGTNANTDIRATAKGMLVEIPVKEGNQVIQANNFNNGTTIAVIADMSKMIFEGDVDESDVIKLKEGTEIEVSIGAIQDKKYPAVLNFIAPKGRETGGAVKFKIKADVTLDDENFVRAGYSANAEMVLDKVEDVLSIKESLLRFDKKTEEPYVEIKTGDNKYTKKKVKLGLSDGVNVQILEGVKEGDEIKIWNKISKGKNSKKS